MEGYNSMAYSKEEEIMTKIIKVNHCGECPNCNYRNDSYSEDSWICLLLSLDDVNEYYFNKTLPDDCPLEDERNDEKFSQGIKEYGEWLKQHLVKERSGK